MLTQKEAQVTRLDGRGLGAQVWSGPWLSGKCVRVLELVGGMSEVASKGHARKEGSSWPTDLGVLRFQFSFSNRRAQLESQTCCR